MTLNRPHQRRHAHSLMELVVAMAASSVLLAGLGSVMMIGRQVAYTPAAANHRIEATDIVSQIAEELRYATLIIQQTPQILEFVVADRDGDGTAEKMRYAWSGVQGAPLLKTLNSQPVVTVLDSVQEFSANLQLKASTTTLTSTVETAEAVLQSNATIVSGTDRDITALAHSSQQINPATFAGMPANATAWNATKVDFHGRQEGGAVETLVVQLRSAGDPYYSPTSQALAQVSIPEASLTSSYNWNTATFSIPARGLSLQQQYNVVWAGIGTGKAARFRPYDGGTASGVLESNDAGATWQFLPNRQMFYRLYGTYTTPGPNYPVSKSNVAVVRLILRTSDQVHARIDSSVPLVNSPELLAAYWRADFDRNPTTTNANGDSALDWALAGSGTFDATRLIGGVWYAVGAIETRPFSDFITPTTVEVRCRNTTVGGNGAVVRINADRQGGQYAPLLVYVQRQADGSQTLTLSGKTSDAATKPLFSRTRISSDFIRFRLTILPQSNVVNLQIKDEDMGTFTYPTYTPTSSSDRFLTLFADTSLAEFDYVDVRVATP